MTNEKKPVLVAPDPSHQVSGPSVGLLVTGIVGAFFSFLGLILSFFGTGFFTIWRDKFGEKYFGKEEFVEGFFEGVVGVASSIVELLVAAFIIYAALKMKELNQWGLCVAASVLAMIPCISPCCILGLPIGIWCLVILVRPEVKEAFS